MSQYINGYINQTLDEINQLHMRDTNMKKLQFAIASIVDANTGNGLVHSSVSRDYVAAERNGRKIRAKSVMALLAVIKSGLGAVTDYFSAAAKQRRDLRTLMSLDEHLLKDIGIIRNDLVSVELGAARLDELNNSRFFARQFEQKNENENNASNQTQHDLAAVNEQYFEQRKCA